MPIPLLDLMDFRSFASLWYWIFVGTLWTFAMQAPLGVPLDLLRRAQSGEDQALEDVAGWTEIELRRRALVPQVMRYAQVALWAFAVSALAVLALLYGIELAQALFALTLPFALVTGLSAHWAHRLQRSEMTFDELTRSLMRLRLCVQGLGLAAIFVSAVWGMLYNLTHYPL